MLIGGVASLSLLAIYFLTMTVLGSWSAAVEQFRALWYLMVPLSAGFGIQVGLYNLIKSSVKASSSLVAGGTSASAGMLACCAHHATDVLPFVGLTGLSIFLSNYQIPILLFNLVINLLGIGYMLRQFNQLKKV